MKLFRRSVVSGVIFAVAAVFLAYTGWMHYAKASALVNHGVKTEGSVVSVRESTSGGKRRRTRYYPMVEFKDAKGDTRRVETTGESRNDFNVGQTVSVVYVPDNPTIADREGSSGASPGFGYFCFAIGGFLTILAAYNFSILVAKGT